LLCHGFIAEAGTYQENAGSQPGFLISHDLASKFFAIRHETVLDRVQ
jgi:hypothetical protein